MLSKIPIKKMVYVNLNDNFISYIFFGFVLVTDMVVHLLNKVINNF